MSIAKPAPSLRAQRTERALLILLGVAVLISASTMLVKQHDFVDVIAGVCLATAAWRVFIFPLDLSSVPRRDRAYPRWLTVAGFGLHFAALGGMYLLYRSGWVPWASG